MNGRYGFDPYAVLGVARDANLATIKIRYRELIVEWHPDISVHPDAHERCAELNQAYAILGDAEMRARYDRGPAAFLGGFREWFEERRRVWSVTECLRCGTSLYGGRVTFRAPDGSKYQAGIWRRRDALYCSNACRQAAYRARKKAAERAARAERQLGRDRQTLEP